MNELRLHTLPGMQIPPPYNLGLVGEDECFSIAASAARIVEQSSNEEADAPSPTVVAARANAVTAFEGLHHEILSLVREGLAQDDGEAWFAFWNEDSRLEMFRDLLDGLRVLERKISELGGTVNYLSADESNHACRQHIIETLPGIEDQIVFVEGLLTKSGRIASQLVREPVHKDKQPQDSNFAAQFNWATSWAMMALNTIAVGTGSHDDEGEGPVVVSSELLGAALAAARQFAFEAYHAVREGQRLRKGDDTGEAEASVATEAAAAGEAADDSDLADVEEAISLEEARRGR